jgi:Icc-related predicted phosphoesterase
MRIFHFSDVHGEIDWLGLADFSGIDLIISTGDFFPNCSRGNVSKEIGFQTSWWNRNRDFVAGVFGSIPILVVNGNHDYICLAENLNNVGCSATLVTPDGVIVSGTRFSGFREIPYIAGEWNGEKTESELSRIVTRTFDSDPEILVTHCPPAGILDQVGGYGGRGISIGSCSLLDALSYRDHRIRAHLFGHNHNQPGTIEHMGIRFHNNACGWDIVEV